MIRAKLSDIAGIINKIAPPALAEDWDNVGLQVGDPKSGISRIMVALDPSREAIDSAIENSCQLLLTHHPLIFKPLKKITSSDETGDLIRKAIKADLAIFSLHTNYDAVQNGINDQLAAALGLERTVPLKRMKSEELIKLVVYIPGSHQEAVANELLPLAEQLGSYDQCSFRVAGTGSFRPLEGATPFIGKTGTREMVEEIRFEMLLAKQNLEHALKRLYKAHPYEEPAYDILPLLNRGADLGIGRIGHLSAPVPLREFAATVKQRLGAGSVRVVGDMERTVSKVALCGGSGISFMHDALRGGADVFVTGDIKYHEACEARALGMALIDAGHFATEHLMVEGFARQLEQELANRRFDAEIVKCGSETDPFVTYC